ncbi:FHA domain-containing protein [Actinoplanes sp. NPDC049596]|uniref:FHA domain-containing protein n=1 Tax=unclassified Actinoplanes TaxID=2626549 RepID=UPI00341CC7A1
MTDGFRSAAGAPTTKARTATLRPFGDGEPITLVVNQPLILGRGSADPAVGRLLADFGDVSREHAEVTLGEDGTVKIVDMESACGTFVGGAKLGPGRPRLVQLPVKIRLGGQCYLNLVGNPAHGEQ